MRSMTIQAERLLRTWGVPSEQMTLYTGDDLKARVRRIHNFIYANDPIKQHSRVFDEIAKVMLAKLEWERLGRADLALPGQSTDLSRDVGRLYADAVRAGEERAEPIQLSSLALQFAWDQLSEVDLRSTDAKGTAFQQIVGAQLRAEKGQFFTPPPAKLLLSAILDLQPDEVVLDPACGSGGLLFEVKTSRVAGIEVDPALARVARLSLLIRGDLRGEIVHADSLAPRTQLGESLPEWMRPGLVDVVMTNPPFGSKAKVVDGEALRDLPALGADRTAVAPEVLFVERVVQWLRPGGRAGIVLPVGLLANPSTSYVREYLRREAEIVATISLPPETFRPAENGVQAALLFIRKRGGSAVPATHTFRAIVRKIGYDHRERPTLRREEDGRPVLDEDVSAVIAAWRDANRRHRWF